MSKAKALVQDKRLYNRILKAAKLIQETCPNINFCYQMALAVGPEIVALDSDRDASQFWAENEQGFGSK